MKTTFRTAFLAIGLTALAATSHAATVTFDLTSDTATRDVSWTGVDFDESGVSLSVTGHRLESDGSVGPTYRTVQTDDGLGVRVGGNDEDIVDSSANDELLLLSFSQDVSITEITFSYLVGDEFSFVAYDGSSVESFDPFLTITDTTTVGNVVYGTFTFDSPLTSDVFAIGADGRNRLDNHGFLLETVTVEAAALQQPVAPVPLPAGGLLLLTGMGGFAALRRKKHVSA